MTHPYRPVDTYKEATPVIPALTRGWRLMFAFGTLPPLIGITMFVLTLLAFGDLVKLPEYFNITAFLDHYSYLYIIPMAELFFWPMIAYAKLSVKFYVFWYSRGRD